MGFTAFDMAPNRDCTCTCGAWKWCQEYHATRCHLGLKPKHRKIVNRHRTEGPND